MKFKIKRTFNYSQAAAEQKMADLNLANPEVKEKFWKPLAKDLFKASVEITIKRSEEYFGDKATNGFLKVIGNAKNAFDSLVQCQRDVAEINRTVFINRYVTSQANNLNKCAEEISLVASSWEGQDPHDWDKEAQEGQQESVGFLHDLISELTESLSIALTPLCLSLEDESLVKQLKRRIDRVNADPLTQDDAESLQALLDAVKTLKKQTKFADRIDDFGNSKLAAVKKG